VPPNSAAAKAGIRATTRDAQGRVRLGDVIVAMQGKKIDSTNDLYLVMEEQRLGSVVNVTVQRDGKQVQLRAVLEAVDEASG